MKMGRSGWRDLCAGTSRTLQPGRVTGAVLCGVLLLAAVAVRCRAQAPDALDEEVRRLLAANHVPSVSIAQIRDGKVSLVRAFGQQDAATAATPVTLYNVASLTKPISAEVILRLISRGEAGLDEPMYTVWTDPDIAQDERRKLLTPRLALSHQTGFANWRRETGDVLRFRNDPGKGFGYSGEGYEYVARFMEKKTGRSIEEQAERLVFEPAGMHATAYTRRPWFGGRIATPADRDGRWIEPSFADKPVASDLLYTTAEDYSRFLTGVMKDEGLSGSIARERSRVQVSTKDTMCRAAGDPACPDEMGMGLGWQVLRFKTKTVLMHTGRDAGLFTFTYVCPTTRSGAVILTNGQNGNLMVVPILQKIGAEPEFVAFLVSAMR